MSASARQKNTTEKHKKLQRAAGLYSDSGMTLGKAAEDASVSVREMMDHLWQKKIPMQYNLQDFQEDLQVIRESRAPGTQGAGNPRKAG